eukprot:PhF_6_TR12275/c0_g1_i1/m.19465
MDGTRRSRHLEGSLSLTMTPQKRLTSEDLLRIFGPYCNGTTTVREFKHSLATGGMPSIPSDEDCSTTTSEDVAVNNNDDDENIPSYRSSSLKSGAGGDAQQLHTVKSSGDRIVDLPYLVREMRQRPPRRQNFTFMQNVLCEQCVDHAITFDKIGIVLSLISFLGLIPLILLNNGWTLIGACMVELALASVIVQLGPLTVYKKFCAQVNQLPRKPLIALMITYGTIILAYACLLPFHMTTRDMTSTPQMFYECISNGLNHPDPERHYYCIVVSPLHVTSIGHFMLCIFLALHSGLRLKVEKERHQQYRSWIREHVKNASKILHTEVGPTWSHKSLIRFGFVGCAITLSPPILWTNHVKYAQGGWVIFSLMLTFIAYSSLMTYIVAYLAHSYLYATQARLVAKLIAPLETNFSAMDDNNGITTHSSKSFVGKFVGKSMTTQFGYRWWRMCCMVESVQREQRIIHETLITCILVLDLLLLTLLCYYVFISREAFVTLMRQCVGVLCVVLSLFLFVIIHKSQLTTSTYMRHVELLKGRLLANAIERGDAALWTSSVAMMVEVVKSTIMGMCPTLAGITVTGVVATWTKAFVVVGIILLSSRVLL